MIKRPWKIEVFIFIYFLGLAFFGLCFAQVSHISGYLLFSI